MEAPAKIRYEKWVVIPVEVKAKATAQIDFKIPVTAKHCTGVAFTVTDFDGGINHNEHLGEVSLLFNNRKSHPVHFQTQFKVSHYRMEHILLKLEEPIETGARVSGYYRNYLDIYQSIKIYLQCIAETE
jgi:hypothetical protein